MQVLAGKVTTITSSPLERAGFHMVETAPCGQVACLRSKSIVNASRAKPLWERAWWE
jgi:hypothetical protein